MAVYFRTDLQSDLRDAVYRLVDERGAQEFVNFGESLRRRRWVQAENLITPGTYTFTFRHDKFHPVERAVRLHADQVTRIEIDLRPVR